MGVDWESIRREFKVVEGRTYLASAAVGGVHRRVRDAAARWIDFTCEHGAAKDDRYFELLTEARTELAGFLGVERDDVAFAPNTSQLMNMLALMLKGGPARELVLPADEFPSSVLAWHHHGFEVKAVPSRRCRVEIEDVLSRVSDRTAAVVASGVQFLHGFRIDLPLLGKELRARGVPLIVNGTQMMGAFAVPLREAGVSAFTASCHKWFGSGIGQAVFYASPGFRAAHTWPFAGWASVEEPFAMRNDPPRLRGDCGAIQLGSLPFAQVAAIMESSRVIASIGQEAISKRILELSDHMDGRLRSLPVTVNTCRDEEPCKSGIINFSPPDPSRVEDLVARLKERKVYINGRRGSLRASVHFYNNEEDVDSLVQHLGPLL